MPVETIGFALKPVGFFERNPALDVPPSEPRDCHPRGDDGGHPRGDAGGHPPGGHPRTGDHSANSNPPTEEST
jgi:primary-amine oxidase